MCLRLNGSAGGRARLGLSVLWVHALAGACASDNTPAPESAAAGEGGEVESSIESLLEPPEEGEGVQFTMRASIDAGSEVELCKFVRSGDETLFVNRDKVRYTTGSHHVLLYTTLYREVPTVDELGNEVDTSGVFDCTAGAAGFWRVGGLVAAAQDPDGEGGVLFPEGIGVRVPPNSVLLINAHYINTTEKVLEPEIAINLHTIPEQELETEAGLLFWYNPFIKIPAGGTASAHAACDLPKDITITTASSHMHKRGVGYHAELVQPDGSSEEVFRTDAWEDVPVEHFEDGLQVEAGSRIRWTCEYENDEERTVYQGAKSSDEMCMFIGGYYPVNLETSFCMGYAQPYFGGDWEIGSGDGSCREALACAKQVERDPGAALTVLDGPLTRGLTDCMEAAAPEVSRELSDAVACLAAAPLGMVDSVCQDKFAACDAM